ncbi:MAG: hypothetical protein ACI39F_06895 [Acutalibacteraceae bacterium]
MKKILSIVLCIIMLGCFAACDKGGKSTLETKTGDVITVGIPEGWSLVSGTDMNGANSADFICNAEKFEIGDSYLQVTKNSGDISTVQEQLKSGDTFGKYIDDVDLNGNTWYIAEKAAAAMIGDYACFVSGYECDFSSDEVQQILGSIKWAK